MIDKKCNPKYAYLLGIVRVFGFPAAREEETLEEEEFGNVCWNWWRRFILALAFTLGLILVLAFTSPLSSL